VGPAIFIFIPMAVLRAVTFSNTSCREQSWGVILIWVAASEGCTVISVPFLALRAEAIRAGYRLSETLRNFSFIWPAVDSSLGLPTTDRLSKLGSIVTTVTRLVA
jgi:hypothetical protein